MATEKMQRTTLTAKEAAEALDIYLSKKENDSLLQSN